jgi:hypothetical protein
VLIQTLRIGERVRISLRGRQAERTNGFTGRVVNVDPRAIRLDVTATRFDRWWSSHPGGQVVLPWARVDAVFVDGAS